jgi:ADP-heptose:LPS heptosyltransferase
LAWTTNGHPVAWLANYSGHRPYWDLARMRADWAQARPGEPFSLKVRDVRLPYHYAAWRVRDVGPGILFLTAEEVAAAAAALWRAGVRGRFAVIEPTIKPTASPNKVWGWSRYQAVAVALADRIALVQLGDAPAVPAERLAGARVISTPSFRTACAVLMLADFYIGPEGGLHHAAAALGVPAIVLFGGFISPEQTGYAEHVNLFTGGEPCGQRVACAHCAEAMARITPEQVIAEAARWM